MKKSLSGILPRFNISPRKRENIDVPIPRLSFTSATSEVYQSENIWEIYDMDESLFRKYKFVIPLPRKVKKGKIRYLYHHDVEYPQVFKIYEVNNRLYLAKWSGPGPLDIFKKDVNIIHPFMVLWDEFINVFEGEKLKRVLVHPEEKLMNIFLQNLVYAQLVKKGNSYQYSIWYIHNPKEYSSD